MSSNERPSIARAAARATRHLAALATRRAAALAEARATRRSVALAAIGFVALSLAAEPRVGSTMPPVVAPLPGQLRPPQRVLWSERFDGPLDWSDPERHGPGALALVYSVQHGGGVSYLHAHHDAARPKAPGAMHFGKSFANAPMALDRVGLFRWRWRAVVQPNVKDDPWLDMAAGIYVVMKEPSLFSKGRGFKFGWLAKAAPINSYQRGILQVPVRIDAASDQWRTEEVDLCAAYRRAFGPCEGERILYVGVVTDADGTRSIAEGDYADFEILGTP